jgi:Trypsin-like peptidase domain
MVLVLVCWVQNYHIFYYLWKKEFLKIITIKQYNINHKMKKHLLLLILIFYSIDVISQNKNITDSEPWMKLPFNQAPQILLTNEANFNGHTSMEGASSFLVQVDWDKENKKIYAVTAKHLIGEDGGVSPEIKPINFNGVLKKWIMYPRTNENEFVVIEKLLDEKQSDPKIDILIFAIKNNSTKIYPLKMTPRGIPLFKENETAFIIGCPYKQKDCKQNIYKGSYLGYDKDESKIVIQNVKPALDMSGFSGAPIVDKDGFVYAVVYGSEKQKNGTMTVWATPLVASILPIMLTETIGNALKKSFNEKDKENKKE